MTNSRKNTLFAMTVTAFVARYKLSSQVRNDLVRAAKEHTNEDWRGSVDGDYHTWLRARAETTLMSDALTGFTKKLEGTGRDLKQDSPKLAATLIARKLTALDVPCLPHTPATRKKMLKSLSKEDLLAADVRKLGTLSSAAIENGYRRYGNPYEIVTVREVLESKPWSGENNYYFKGVRSSLLLTRQYLRELGFKYEDGPFMQDGTRRQFIEKLMTADSLGKRHAVKVAGLAMKYRWIPKFAE